MFFREQQIKTKKISFENFPFFLNLINDTKNNTKISTRNTSKRLYSIFTPTENMKDHNVLSHKVLK